MRRAAAALLAAAALAGGVGACGGDDSDSGSDAAATPAAPSADQRAAFDELRQCLSEQGVDVPDPGSGGPPGERGEPDPELLEAFEACRDILPAGELPGPGGAPPGSGG